MMNIDSRGMIMAIKRRPYLSRLSLWNINYFIIFGIIAFWKTPQVFVKPRFLGEKASLFYPYCLSHTVVECFLHVHLGYYQLLTNAIVLLASRTPILYAPVITTLCALMLHIIVVYQLISFARCYRLSHICIVLLVTGWALLPQTFEVWMNATNAQWVVGVSMLLILVSRLSGWRIGGRWYLRGPRYAAFQESLGSSLLRCFVFVPCGRGHGSCCL